MRSLGGSEGKCVYELKVQGGDLSGAPVRLVGMAGVRCGQALFLYPFVGYRYDQFGVGDLRLGGRRK